MSKKSTSLHLRDINKPPPHLDLHQQKKWINAAVKAKKNHERRQQYPAFTIPTVMYEVKFVNKHTTLDTLQLLINHVERCEEYSIDTEGDKITTELALIQIQTIPHEFPMFVIIVELSHLPSSGSPSNVLIKNLFRIIFRSTNKVYTWGSLGKELASIKDNGLFDWPIKTKQFNIQLLFTNWYNWALSSCGISGPGRSRINDVNNAGCLCHPPNPYRVGELWSLQLALINVSGLFIDKSTTLYEWSKLLDPSHSTWSFSTREKLIRYIIYDCFTTTYFVKPVLEYWTFEELSKINITDLFTTSSKSSSITNNNDNNIKNNFKKNNKVNKNIDGQMLMNVLDDDVQFISEEEEEDDEILASTCISSSINNDGFFEIILNNDDDVIVSPVKQNISEIIQHDSIYENISDEELETVQRDPIYGNISDNEPEIQLQENDDVIMNDHADNDELSSTKPRVSKHQTRSAAVRHRMNHKRNKKRKRRRYRYAIRRRVFNRFPMFLIRNVLQLYNIYYTHVKMDEDAIEDELVIGLKDRFSRTQAQRRLPNNIFNKQGYYHYRRLYKC